MALRGRLVTHLAGPPEAAGSAVSFNLISYHHSDAHDVGVAARHRGGGRAGLGQHRRHLQAQLQCQDGGDRRRQYQ